MRRGINSRSHDRRDIDECGYGERTRVKNSTVFINDIESGTEILKSQLFRVDHPLRNSRQIFGPTVLDTEHEKHSRKKKHWSLSFRKSTVEDHLSCIVDAAIRDGFQYAETQDDLFRVCEYIPNKVVLGILERNDLDPLTHYEKLKPMVEFLEYSNKTEGLQAAKDYARTIAFEDESLLFQEMDGPEREHELSLFLIAGAETTIIAMKILTRAWSAQFQVLKDSVEAKGLQPAIIDALVSDAPLGLATRFCSEDTIIAGREIKKGDIVHVDISRANKQVCPMHGKGNGSASSSNHLVFGAGRHRCPGGHLALLELCKFVEVLLTKKPEDYAISTNIDDERPMTFRHPRAIKIKRRQALECTI